MGNYFVMSTRFDKSKASDFGFISKDSNTAIDPNDNSIWIKINLYDFGWGKENGFYKRPLPDFDTLFELVLYSTNKDDMYGAAAVILEKFPDKLLIQCEKMINAHHQKQEIKRIVELFNLKYPINRCVVLGKNNNQIQDDFTRWKKISETIKDDNQDSQGTAD